MSLIDKRGTGYLFQLKPSLFPEGEVTWTECMLWNLFYTEKNGALERSKA